MTPYISEFVLIHKKYFRKINFITDSRQSSSEIRSTKHLKELLLSGEVYRHPVRKEDTGKLRSSVYGVVDAVYDMENKYVSKAYICKVCTKSIFAEVEGGNSKLRQHPCVKKYLQQLKHQSDYDDDEDEVENFYCSRFLLDPRHKLLLADVFVL